MPTDNQMTVKMMLNIQRLQQGLWYDKDLLTDKERAAWLDELLLGLHEEVAELARITRRKPHVVRAERADSGNRVEELIDALKYLLAIADLLGIDAETLSDRYVAKSQAVAQKVEQYRLELAGQRVFVTDLDECVADLSVFFSETGGMYGTPTAGLLETEAKKDAWYNGGGFLRLGLIPDAVEALREAKANGCLVAIITARPVWEHYRVRTDTVAWLKEHDVPCDILLFNKDKWDAVHQSVYPATVVGALDDRDKHAIELAAHHVPNVMLMDRPWNATMDNDKYNIKRVSGWGDVLSEMRRTNWGKAPQRGDS